MIKKADIVLGLVILVIGILLLTFFAYTGQEGQQVRVSLEGSLYGVYPLGRDTEISIGNGSHHNLLVIEDGKAYMKEANCPDGYCLHQFEKSGGISRSNERIVCLPNRVIVTIDQDRSEVKNDEMGGGFDAITG